MAASDSDSLNMEKLVAKVGDQVKSQWYKFGQTIEVPKHFLDQLSGEDIHCLTQVLEYWLRHHPGQPTWQEVADAQKKVQPQFEKASNEGINI